MTLLRDGTPGAGAAVIHHDHEWEEIARVELLEGETTRCDLALPPGVVRITGRVHTREMRPIAGALVGHKASLAVAPGEETEVTLVLD